MAPGFWKKTQFWGSVLRSRVSLGFTTSGKNFKTKGNYIMKKNLPMKTTISSSDKLLRTLSAWDKNSRSAQMGQIANNRKESAHPSIGEPSRRALLRRTRCRSARCHVHIFLSARGTGSALVWHFAYKAAHQSPDVSVCDGRTGRRLKWRNRAKRASRIP